MFRHFRCWFLLMVYLVLLNTPAMQSVAAQDDKPTLRSLADKSHFYIGAAASPSHFGDPAYKETLSREFNMLTPENEAKFSSVHPEQGQYTFQSFDILLEFAKEHNMVVRGHTLVWHQFLPAWVSKGTFSRDEAIQVLHDHISTVVGRYKGRVPIWDVVNEAIDDAGSGLRDTPWRKLIGDDYVELAFRFAHEADPEALLFYNDYSTEGLSTKSDAVYKMVKDLVARGVPINGVGLQSHFTVGEMDTAGIAANMKRLGELGLQVQITEMDDRYPVNSTDAILQPQAGDYRKLLATCLDSPYCTAFVTWGVNDLYSWLRNSGLGFYDNPTVKPLLFDDAYQPKPAYYAVLDILSRHAGGAAILSDAELAVMDTMPVAPVVEVKLPPPRKTDAAQLTPDPVDGAAYYVPFPVAITLDGQDDDWGNIPRVSVDKGSLIPANNTTTMRFAVAADAAYVYFLVDVEDSKLIYGKHDLANEWYQEDSVEIYLNMTSNLKLVAYEPGVVQIGIPVANIANPKALVISGRNSSDVDVQAVVVKTDEGYRVEAAVPLVTDVWSMTPIRLAKVGFQIAVNGSSGEGRDTKMIWSRYDMQDQSYMNPSVFGQLIFWRVKPAN